MPVEKDQILDLVLFKELLDVRHLLIFGQCTVVFRYWCIRLISGVFAVNIDIALVIMLFRSATIRAHFAPQIK